jgi:hypothetical protein
MLLEETTENQLIFTAKAWVNGDVDSMSESSLSKLSPIAMIQGSSWDFDGIGSP